MHGMSLLHRINTPPLPPKYSTVLRQFIKVMLTLLHKPPIIMFLTFCHLPTYFVKYPSITPANSPPGTNDPCVEQIFELFGVYITLLCVVRFKFNIKET